MTNQEPITLENSPDHCYLKTGEFTNDPRCNIFQSGTITYDDHYGSISAQMEPLVKVNLELISNPMTYCIFRRPISPNIFVPPYMHLDIFPSLPINSTGRIPMSQGGIMVILDLPPRF